MVRTRTGRTVKTTTKASKQPETIDLTKREDNNRQIASNNKRKMTESDANASSTSKKAARVLQTPGGSRYKCIVEGIASSPPVLSSPAPQRITLPSSPGIQYPIDYEISFNLQIYDQKLGLVSTPFYEDCTRADLTEALEGADRLITSTMQGIISPLEEPESMQIRVIVSDLKANPRIKQQGPKLVTSVSSYDDVVIQLCDDLVKTGSESCKISIKTSIKWNKDDQKAAQKELTRREAQQSVKNHVNDEAPVRNTRTNQLLNHHRVELDRDAAAGDLERRLKDKWGCRDEHCSNQLGNCYYDVNSNLERKKHYAMSQIHLKSWANSIQAGLASYDNPTFDMQAQIVSGGGIMGGNRRPNTPRNGKLVQEFEELQQSILKGKMIELQIAQVDRQLAYIERREGQDELAHKIRIMHKIMQLQEAAELSSKSNRLSVVKRAVSLPIAPTMAVSNLPVSPLHDGWPRPRWRGPRSSSRIAPDNTLPSSDWVGIWFDWMIDRETNDDKKLDLVEGKRIARDAKWSVNDMQNTTKIGSETHQESISNGIKRWICRQFGQNWKTFKNYTRNQSNSL